MTSRNQQLAKILYEIADILEINGVPFKPNAFRKAAQTVESLSEDIDVYYKEGKLRELPSIGESIAAHIEEFLKTGKIKRHEELKKSVPVDFEKLTAIRGLGPKKIKKLYDALGIRDIDSLKKAATAHKIAIVPGFGEKSEQEILHGIELLERTGSRALIGYILEDVNAIVTALKASGAVEQISPAGSVRRCKETVGDIDILITSNNPQVVMDRFSALPEVEEMLEKGKTKSSARLKNGLNCDVRVVEPSSFGSALQYFTGSKEHNIALRRIAIQKGWKLNEYGLFDRNGKKVAGEKEEDVYAALGLPFIPPELRENAGEIEAAKANMLPKIIDLKDIRGDLHCHTKYSDGTYSVAEMAKAGETLGYEYIALTDHSRSLKIAHGMDERKINARQKEIDGYKGKIRILSGTELEILKDGSLDYPKSILKQFDIVVAGVHSHFRMHKKEMTARICTAMENEHVDIIAHPTGRLIGRRDAYQVDIDEILDKAKETETALEIDAYPDRLDLSAENCRKAVERGIMIAIGTDAHSVDHLRFMALGVATARRGWCEKKNVLNCMPIEKLEKWLGV